MKKLSVTPKHRQFLGSEAITTYSEAKTVILPIPYEKTTTYRKGCENGALAIIEASDQLEAYDDELGKETCIETGIYTQKAIADTRVNPTITPEEMLAATTEAVSQLIHDGKFMIALGGEHAITEGVVKAYQKALSDSFTVVQIDAHGDLRFSYQGSIYNHACVMRRILDMGLPTLPVGIRSICKEEAELIAARKIPVIYAREIYYDRNWMAKAIANMTTKRVFITIDLDGLDPSLLPGVGTPEPGGLNWYELTQFLKQIFLQKEVIGCDVTELAPLQDSVVSQFTAAKLVYKLIGYHSLA
ncbi:Agmatinase 1 [Hyella patelloides LEGE 07179]|uniref:Agmatinase 1 n=1 Tax=Hyella patelloides LEGE 07179 TaxID=945734 RepID=A0A563VK26_9CYAN|nr:agmatinase [Hyella patelloides]VEP11687.1 Agmatinase 1 [Hyella patelloides LEGE 07179]